MAVGEVEELLPIVEVDGMGSAPFVETDSLSHRRFDSGPLFGTQTAFAKEALNRLGSFCGQKRATRVPPPVLLGGGDIDGAGRNQGDEHVPIDRQIIDALAEGGEIGIEPIREAGGDGFDGFAILTAHNEAPDVTVRPPST